MQRTKLHDLRDCVIIYVFSTLVVGLGTIFGEQFVATVRHDNTFGLQGNELVLETTTPGRLHHKLCSEQHLFQIAFIPTCGQAFVFDSDL